MRKTLAAIFLFGLCSLPLLAQDYPKVEVFGGYQYLRLGGDNPAINANGWNASVAANLNKTLGIAADFSGAYKTVFGVSVKTYSYTFGPVISFNHEGKVNPFAHALFGGNHVGAYLAGFNGVSASTNGFTMMYGGGADVKVSRRFAIRVAQADWVYYRISGNNSSRNLRISTGIVARF